MGLVVWLIFLFSTLGISASDFFCPNLATISAILGLDENVAGVTFLALGNGSPDVFSTFSAMKAGSGSLAIGELIGAATFIVSVVVGSMALIKPFKVNRGPFLRDVGFFTMAIVLLLAVLFDGIVRGWEAGLLVLLYAIYVAVVVATSMYERRLERRKRKESLLRAQYGPGDSEEASPITTPYHDDAQEPYRDDASKFLMKYSTNAHTSYIQPMRHSLFLLHQYLQDTGPIQTLRFLANRHPILDYRFPHFSPLVPDHVEVLTLRTVKTFLLIPCWELSSSVMP